MCHGEVSNRLHQTGVSRPVFEGFHSFHRTVRAVPLPEVVVLGSRCSAITGRSTGIVQVLIEALISDLAIDLNSVDCDSGNTEYLVRETCKPTLLRRESFQSNSCLPFRF